MQVEKVIWLNVTYIYNSHKLDVFYDENVN